MWLLDTNAWIAYLSPRPSPIKTRIASMASTELYICDVVKSELYYGAYKSARVAENKANIERLFTVIANLTFDQVCADYVGQIRHVLAQQGTPIGSYDVMIAAIARRYDRVLVTHNTREFERVPHLRLEDWQL